MRKFLALLLLLPCLAFAQATAITVNEFNPGLGAPGYAWSNLTITGGTAVNDASSTGQFSSGIKALQIGGTLYSVSSRTDSNNIVLATAVTNGSGVSASHPYYSWNNLTVSGTTVTDAGAQGIFASTFVGRPLWINGIAYSISAYTNSNVVSVSVAPGNTTGAVGKLGFAGIVIERAAGITGACSGSTTWRNVPLSGTYTGTPAAADVQLTYSLADKVATPGATFKAWFALSSFTASAGTWSGTAAVPCSNDWVVAQVRDHTSTSIVSNTQAIYWGVGVKFFGTGQSNWAYLTQSGTTALSGSQDSRTAFFDHSGWHPVYVTQYPGMPAFAGAVTSDTTIRLMNELANSLGCVVGMASFPVPGTSIKQWLLSANGGFSNASTSNVWTTGGSGNGGNVGASGGGTSLADAAGANSAALMPEGTDYEALFFQQGEQDASGSGNASTYGTLLAALETQMLAVTGRSAGQMEYVIAPVGSYVIAPGFTTATPDSGFNLVRNFELTNISGTTGAIYGGGVLDAAHWYFDPVEAITSNQQAHWSYTDWTVIGKRYTRALMQAFGLNSTGAKGPSISTASMPVGSNTITVTVAHTSGTALVGSNGSTSGSNFLGFTVTVNGTVTAPTASALTGASTLTLTMPAVRGSGDTITVQYDQGANPNGIMYGSWTNLTVSGTAVTDASSTGQFNVGMVGSSLVISSVNYTISSRTDANHVTLASSPSGGSGITGAVTVNGGEHYAAQEVYDNYGWSGFLYPDTNGFPLQPTNGAITVTAPANNIIPMGLGVASIGIYKSNQISSQPSGIYNAVAMLPTCSSNSIYLCW